MVLTEGFYEWKADAGGRKQPYYVSFGEGSVMRMAGLYDVWAGALIAKLLFAAIFQTQHVVFRVSKAAGPWRRLQCYAAAAAGRMALTG